MTRRHFLATGAAAAAAVTACRDTRPRASGGSATTRTPGSPGVPQVVVVDGREPPSFAPYISELLAVEGVIGVAHADGRRDGTDVLARVQAAVAYGPRLAPAWTDALEAFVQRGGVLVGIEPPATLLARFGIVELPGDGIPGPHGDVPARITFASRDRAQARVHVPVRAWRVTTGHVEASCDAGPAGLGDPVAVRVERGYGCATFWSCDVARNIAVIRQGNPAWVDQDRDAAPGVRVIDAMRGWLQPEQMERVDADLLARAVVDGLTPASARVGPLVRADYFPSDARAVMVATSDAHGVGAGVLEQFVQRIEAAGGAVSIYYAPPDASTWRLHARRWRWAAGDLPLVGGAAFSVAAPPPPRMVDAWRRRGHEFAPHPSADGGVERGLSEAWQRFEADGYGTAHVTTRTHKVLWTGWAGSARAQQAVGVRMNLDAYPVGPALRRADGAWGHGHITGSGLPSRFVDESGALIECYQQATQIVDEQLLGAFGGPEGLTGAEAGAVAARLIGASADAPPVAWCGQFHADGFAADAPRASQSAALLDGVLDACQRHRIPVWSASRWLAFLDARRATRLIDRAWDAERRTLTCTMDVGSASAANVGLLVPAGFDGTELADARIDGALVTVSDRRIDGRQWARCQSPAGLHRLELTYR